MMSKRALIIGISGQDGTYLAELLLKKGYEVYGTSRDAQVGDFRNLIQRGIRERVIIESVAPNDFRSVLQTMIKVQPDEVYNLSGQSSVGLSFQQPVETFESIAVATINIMEAIRFAGGQIKFYNACSGECFGETQQPAIEETPFRPRSPYGVAKAASFWQVDNYREAYGLFACSGILFNHESPLRPERFVTRKIVKTACRIAERKESKLRLGNISIRRDWGWAPEYVEAMWLMMQQERPDDYLIATGETHLLSEFIEAAFSFLNLDWQKFVISDPELYRPSDLSSSEANPEKAAKNLNWKANSRMIDVVRMMVEQEVAANIYESEKI